MNFPHPGGFGGQGFGIFQTIVTDIVAGIVFIVLLAVAVALIFLIVRFLISMTRAADLYVSLNRRPVDAGTTTVTTETTPAPVTPTATTRRTSTSQRTSPPRDT